MYGQLLVKPIERKIKNPTYLEGQFHAHGGEFASTLILCLVATAPPLDSYPFHPFPTPSAHITQFTTTSTIMVFFVRDTIALKQWKVFLEISDRKCFYIGRFKMELLNKNWRRPQWWKKMLEVPILVLDLSTCQKVL